jgi:cell volume regulation protein A
LLRSFGIGLALGGTAGLVWLLLLRFLHDNEHAYPVTLSALLILYVVIERAGGSAALGILTVAVILGNALVLSKKIGLAEPVELDTRVRGFHRQMAFMIKSFFFVFIGAMLRPPWSLILLGVIFGGVLFASRLPGVFLALVNSDLDENQRRLAAVAMPRGMAAGVLATLPATAGVPGTEDLPVVVFACVFTTILIFAVGFPVVKRNVPAAPEAATYPVPAGGAQPSVRPAAFAATVAATSAPSQSAAVTRTSGEAEGTGRGPNESGQ